jgi:hypothetical protein
MKLIEQVKAARRVNTPLLAIQTADQPATQVAIAKSLNGSAPAFAWDAVRGLRPADEAASKWIKTAGDPATIAAQTGNVNAALDWATNLPERAVLFLTNLDLFVGDPVTATAVLNLREAFKLDKRTLIGTGASFTLPASLQSSVVVIDEPLPTDDELAGIIERIYDDARRGAELPALTPEVRDETVTATRGLSSFMAEQTVAMSLVKGKGIDTAEVWARKRIAFNQTPGVTLDRESGPTFADIEGLAQILARERAHFNGSAPAAVIVRIEEIDKIFGAATAQDTSNTSQAALGYVLDWMQEVGATGFIAVGPGGSGKSLVSKALGREFRRPVVTFDVEATKGGIVGQSGAQMRAALKAIRGLAGDKPTLVVATCNKESALPPELRRRFRQGIWFFDLPTEAERRAIWKLYGKKFGITIKASDLPEDHNWTGAEILTCVETAAQEGISLKESAAFIVPVAEADPAGLAALREKADGAFLNASAPGKYRKPAAVGATGDGRRKMDLND